MLHKFGVTPTWRGSSHDLGRMTLPALWLVYLTYPTILIYFALCSVAAAVAVDLATRWEEVVLPVLEVLIAYPVAWYLLHRFILHGRWLYKMKWSAALWKRVHFDHHQDPHRLDVLFGAPINTIPTIALVTVPLGYATAGLAGAAAAMATGFLMTCVYEFIHCIQHLNYNPRSRLVRRIKQDHLMHHYYNEHGNYGIMSFTPDLLFGTYHRRAREVPKSATVHNIGYDIEEARRYPYVMNLTGAPPRDRPAPAFVSDSKTPP